MKTIKCDISTVTLIENDMLFIDIESDKDFNLKDFNQLKEAAAFLGRGKKLYNLINVGIYTLPDDVARRESASKDGSIFKKADAFIVHSLPQRLIANLYLKFNKPLVPTKFFKDKKVARNWLYELRSHELKAC